MFFFKFPTQFPNSQIVIDVDKSYVPIYDVKYNVPIVFHFSQFFWIYNVPVATILTFTLFPYTTLTAPPVIY